MKQVISLYEKSIEMTVPFYDVDSMNIVWHGNYFKYFERAREALLNELGFGYRKMMDSGYAFPVVDSRVKYIAPLRFEQKAEVIASLIEYENRLHIRYVIIDISTRKKLTEGYTIQVTVEVSSGLMSFVSPQELIEGVEEKLV